MKTRSMVDGPVRLIPVQLAVTFGITQAVFLQQVHYWLDTFACKRDKSHYHEDRWWVWNSYDAWREQLPWLSHATIKRTISALRDKGVLITRHRGFPRKLWFTIDYDRVGGLLGDGVELTLPGEGQNDPNERVKMTLPVRSKMTLPSYTKINTENTGDGLSLLTQMYGRD